MSDKCSEIIFPVLTVVWHLVMPTSFPLNQHGIPSVRPGVCQPRFSAVPLDVYQPWSPAVHSDMCPKGGYMATRQTTSYPFPDASLKTSSIGAFNNTTSLDFNVKSSSRKKTNNTLVLQSGMFMFHTDTLVGSNRTLRVETQTNTTGANMSNSSNQYVESMAAFDVPILSVSNSSNQSVVSVVVEVSNRTTGFNSSNSTSVTWKRNKMVKPKKSHKKPSTRPTKNTPNRTALVSTAPVETKNSTDDNETVHAMPQNATENSTDDNTTVPVVAQNVTENSTDDNETVHAVPQNATENSTDDNETVHAVPQNATENTTADNTTFLVVAQNVTEKSTGTNTTVPVETKPIIVEITQTPVQTKPTPVETVDVPVETNPIPVEIEINELIPAEYHNVPSKENTTGRQVAPYEPEVPEDTVGEIVAAVVCLTATCIYNISSVVCKVMATRGKPARRGDAPDDNSVDSASAKPEKSVVLLSGCAHNLSLPDQDPRTGVCYQFGLLLQVFGYLHNNGKIMSKLFDCTQAELNNAKRDQPGVMDTTTLNVCAIPDRDHTVLPTTGDKVMVANTLFVFVGFTFAYDSRHATLLGPKKELKSFFQQCLICRVKVEQLRVFTDVTIKELLGLIKEDETDLKEYVDKAVAVEVVFRKGTSMALIECMTSEETAYKNCILVISTHTSVDPSAAEHCDNNLWFPSSTAMNEVYFWLMLLACPYKVFAFLFTCHAGGYMKEPEEVRATLQRGGHMEEGINVSELLEDTIARLEVARNLLQAHEPGQNS